MSSQYSSPRILALIQLILIVIASIHLRESYRAILLVQLLLGEALGFLSLLVVGKFDIAIVLLIVLIVWSS